MRYLCHLGVIINSLLKTGLIGLDFFLLRGVRWKYSVHKIFVRCGGNRSLVSLTEGERTGLSFAVEFSRGKLLLLCGQLLLQVDSMLKASCL